VVLGVRKADGGLTWIAVNSRPPRRAGETAPHAVVTTFTDVSGRRQLEEELRQVRAELAEAVLVEVRPDAGRRRVALGGRQRGREVLHDARVGV